MFRPYSLIRKHNYIEQRILDSARANNLGTTVVECNKDLQPFCFNMSVYGLNFFSDQFEKNELCNKCVTQAQLDGFFGSHNYVSLNSLLPPLESEVIERVELAFQLSKPQIIYDDIDFCELSSYELRLQHAAHFRIAPTLYPEWKKQTELCLRLFLGAQQFFTNRTKCLVVAYNRLYSLNNCFLLAAERAGHLTLGVQANGRPSKIYERVTLARNVNEPLMPAVLPAWQTAKISPLSPIKVLKTALILKDYFLSKGGWAFSLAASTAGKSFVDEMISNYRLGLSLLTLSSCDELFAAQAAGIPLPWNTSEAFFENQRVAISEFINLAKLNPEMLFVIRPHPRDCGVKRGTRNISGVSESLGKLLKSSPEFPTNVYFNMPEDGVSLYDFLRRAKYVFNVNSTSGVHNVALGKTTIDLSDNRVISYPTDINESLRIFLKTPSTDAIVSRTTKTVTAWRWIHFQHYGNSLNLKSFIHTEKLFYLVTRNLEDTIKTSLLKQFIFRLTVKLYSLDRRRKRQILNRKLFRTIERHLFDFYSTPNLLRLLSSSFFRRTNLFLEKLIILLFVSHFNK